MSKSNSYLPTSRLQVEREREMREEVGGEEGTGGRREMCNKQCSAETRESQESLLRLMNVCSR